MLRILAKEDWKHFVHPCCHAISFIAILKRQGVLSTVDAG